MMSATPYKERTSQLAAILLAPSLDIATLALMSSDDRQIEIDGLVEIAVYAARSIQEHVDELRDDDLRRRGMTP